MKKRQQTSRGGNKKKNKNKRKGAGNIQRKNKMKKSNVDEAHVQLHMGIFFQK